MYTIYDATELPLHREQTLALILAAVSEWPCMLSGEQYRLRVISGVEP